MGRGRRLRTEEQQSRVFKRTGVYWPAFAGIQACKSALQSSDSPLPYSINVVRDSGWPHRDLLLKINCVECIAAFLYLYRKG